MNTPIHYKFSDLIQTKNIFELHIATCEKPPKNFNIHDASRSDFFSIGILVKGEVNIKIGLKDEKVTKNSMFFLAPSTLKQLMHTSEDVLLYKVIFTSKFLLQIGIEPHEIEMIDYILTSSDRIVNLHDKEVTALSKLVEDLKQKNEHASEHPFGEDIVKYTFRIFLSELAAIGINHNISGKSKVTRKQDLTMRFARLVNQNFKEQRSVKYYAEQLSITPNYLTEIIHEVTGKSPSGFIDEKVMNEAKILLNNPRLTIAQIADVLHFSDQSFLGKFFKRHIGVSPSEYRGHHFTTAI